MFPALAMVVTEPTFYNFTVTTTLSEAGLEMPPRDPFRQNAEC